MNPFPIGEMFGLVDPEMLVVSHVNQSVIPPPPIGVNNGFRAYALENDLNCLHALQSEVAKRNVVLGWFGN